MGGYVAFQFARKYPQRLRALVLCNTRSAADTPEARQARMKMVEQVLAAGPAAVADAMLPRFFTPESFQRVPGAVEFVRERILLTSAEGIAAALRGLAERPDMTELARRRLRVPTLVVAGSDDVITPESEMREMAAKIANSEFVVLPGVGHLTAVEAPVEFNAVLARFLAQRGRRPGTDRLEADGSAGDALGELAGPYASASLAVFTGISNSDWVFTIA